MSIEVALDSTPDTRNRALEGDARWQLVQRIIKTEGFQRSEQLRKILLYVSSAAILNPEEVLREYDIALNALGRRKDFDPGHDNIVRVQFTHLRRKVDKYFVEEGRGESLCISIPKGSYVPVFALQPEEIAPPPAELQTTESTPELAAPSKPLEESQRSDPPRNQPVWMTALLVVGLVGWIAFGFVVVHRRVEIAEYASSRDINPAFAQFLTHFHGHTSVVVPDTSEMMIRIVTGAEISPDDYSRKDFPERQISEVRDPEVRDVLSMLGSRRNTTASEANIALDLISSLRQVGRASDFRYARDLHVRDFNEGNTILLGSQQSDPWVSLFTSQMNFKIVREPGTGTYFFINTKPRPGEQARYSLYQKEAAEHENYGHIALVPNSSKSGFVLVVEGSDMESVEASINYLMHGQINPEITSILTRNELKYFEIFFRGRHLLGESEDTLEVLSVRSGD